MSPAATARTSAAVRERDDATGIFLILTVAATARPRPYEKDVWVARSYYNDICYPPWKRVRRRAGERDRKGEREEGEV